MTRERKLAYAALLTTTVIWGFAPPIIKYTLNFVTPTVFLFYRFLFVSLILVIPLFFRFKSLEPQTLNLAKYLVLGFLGTPLTLMFLFDGIQRTTAIDASVISIISPILVVLGGAFFLKEKVTETERVGIVLTLLGTIITILQPLFETGLSFSQNLWGNTLVLFGTVTWASFTLLTKKEDQKKLDPLVLTASSFLLGTLVIFPLFLFERLSLNDYLKSVFIPTQSIFFIKPQAIFGILYMSILGSVVAYFTYIYGLTKIEASEATIFTYLQPLFAVPAAAIFLDEKITFPFLLGAFLIILGVFICEKR